MMAVAAPAAHAAPTPIGGCTGSVFLATFFSGTTQVNLGDQTTIGLTVKTKLQKDQSTKVAIGGDCSTVVRPGDPIHPAGGLVSPLTPKAIAGKLLGNIGCASGATAEAVDATNAAAWPLSGKIVWTMTQLNDLAKPYQIQGQVGVLGFDPTQQDVIDVGGIVLKGPAFSATITGSVWFDPVSFTGGPGGYNTGWELDLTNAAGCADGTPNNASITQVLSGGGGASATSLLGGTAAGINFSLGE